MTDKWEILDIKKKTSIKTNFTRMYAFADSLAPARDTSNKWGFVNTSGHWVIQPILPMPVPSVRGSPLLKKTTIHGALSIKKEIG